MPLDPQLQELVERARSGDSEPYDQLLVALRREGRTDSASLVALARSDEPILRRAALDLLDDDPDDDLLAALTTLAYDSASAVRQALADVLAEHGWWPLDHLVASLMTDTDSDVRLAAVRAARWRPALEPRLIERLTGDDYWRARQEIARQ